MMEDMLMNKLHNQAPADLWNSQFINKIGMANQFTMRWFMSLMTLPHAKQGTAFL
jgi:hypothetical protein